MLMDARPKDSDGTLFVDDGDQSTALAPWMAKLHVELAEDSRGRRQDVG